MTRASRAVAIMTSTLIAFSGSHARADETGQINKSEPTESLTRENKVSPLPGEVSHIIFFDFDSEELNTFAGGVIANVIEAAKEGSVSEIVIKGHTDLSGSRSYNDRLSSRRAEAVRRALREVGLADITITVKGLGEQTPLIATEDGVRQPQNRRAEVSLKTVSESVSADEGSNGGDDEMHEVQLHQDPLLQDAVFGKAPEEETTCQESSPKSKIFQSYDPLWGGWLSEVRIHNETTRPRLHHMIAMWFKGSLA